MNLHFAKRQLNIQKANYRYLVERVVLATIAGAGVAAWTLAVMFLT